MKYMKILIKKNSSLYKKFLHTYMKLRRAPLVRVYIRYKFAKSYYTEKFKLVKRWSFLKTESDNFYYDLTDKNLQDLIYLIASLVGKSFNEVERYALEIKNNKELKHHIRSIISKNKDLRDVNIAFGRRIGWYILVRILKPKTVVETGVHHGVGACVISSALMQNSLEGNQGSYIGTDLDPNAGVLFCGQYKNFGKIMYGDSIQSLQKIDSTINLFINDSDHNPDYELREYETVMKSLAKDFVILGDNSHVSSSLLYFAKKNDYKYIFFSEEPENHWYPGAGIGICTPSIPV